MDQTQAIVTIFAALITAGLGGGVAALVMLPKQRRQMDANTTKIVVDAAGVMINELQEDAHAARREVASLRSEVDKLRSEVMRLTADLEDRDRTIARLRERRA